MRKKSLSDRYMEERLIEWAEWVKRGCDSGIGFSHRSIISRLREGGGLIINVTGPQCPVSNPLAEEIEFLIKTLAKQNDIQAKLLRIYYLNPIDHIIKAKRLGYEKSRYYQHVEIARQWIKEHLVKQKNCYKNF